VKEREPTSSESAGIAIVTDPLVSVVAAELKAPLVSVTDPVGADVPETVIVAVTAVPLSIVVGAKKTATVGVVGVATAGGTRTAEVFEGTLDCPLITASA
jgi:predicted histidine transporter YuiF (NhaC family)